MARLGFFPLMLIGVLHCELSAQEQDLGGHDCLVNAVAYSRDGKLFASGCPGVIKVWDARNVKEIVNLEDKSLTSLAFSPDSRGLASGSILLPVTVWDAMTGKVLSVQHDAIRMVTCIAFSPDGKVLASGESEGDIVFWDVGPKSERTNIPAVIHSVESIAFSPDGKQLAIVGGYFDKEKRSIGEVVVCEVATGKTVAEFLGHTSRVKVVLFSPDGKTLITGGGDQTIRLWDVAGRNEIATMKGHGVAVSSLSLSQDGKLLASGGGVHVKAGKQGEIKLWDFQERKELGTVKSSFKPVMSVALSPDGKTLVSGGGFFLEGQGELKVWDVESILGK